MGNCMWPFPELNFPKLLGKFYNYYCAVLQIFFPKVSLVFRILVKSEQNTVRNVVYQDIIDKDEILEGLELAPKFEIDNEYASKFQSTKLNRAVSHKGLRLEPEVQALFDAIPMSQLITGHKEEVEPDGNCFFR